MKFLVFCCLMASALARAEAARPQVLKKSTFRVCGAEFVLEMARRESERSLGMMYRDGVPEGTGMVFIFESEQPLSFWMRNVPFDLDIAYFDKRGRLLNSMTMAGTSPVQRPESLPTYASHGKAQYAVELRAGTYAKMNLTKCLLSPLPR